MNPETINVGKHGYVKLIDSIGNDQRIVDAARTSYGKGTKSSRSNKGLIRYLMRHDHTSPFEMVDFTFLVQCPMSVWRQWIRHRTVSINEYSTRYSEAIDLIDEVDPENWRLQSNINKQGSEGRLSDSAGRLVSHQQNLLHTQIRKLYQDKLKIGISREQARDDLPLGTYTRAYWKINLHNLFHFLKLRLDLHAQQEIREYAQAIATLIKPVVPVAFEAFEDFKLNTLTLNKKEIAIIHDLFYPIGYTEKKILDYPSVQYNYPEPISSERDELLAKLETLGVMREL